MFVCVCVFVCYRCAVVGVCLTAPSHLVMLTDASRVYVRVCPASGGVCLSVNSDVKPTQETVSDEQGIRYVMWSRQVFSATQGVTASG